MKYKIEIWQYHSITATFESEDIEEILSWYNDEWRYCYEAGGCTFYLYKDGEELSVDTEIDLGFI